MVSREERAALAEALDLLPDDAREVITLFYREGRSARQVADLLGLREDAVKKRLERARSALRAAVLDRFGEAVRRTAPGAAFTAVVAASLTIASPGAAAAATAVGSGAIPGAGKVAVGVGGAGAGIAAGLAGLLFNHRRRMRRARDDEERRGLRRVAVVMGGLVVALSAMIQVAAALGSPTVLVGSWLAALPVYLHLFLWRLPRVVARREAAERAEDPAAWRRHRRERRCAIAGVAFGAIAGSATVAWAALHL